MESAALRWVTMTTVLSVMLRRFSKSRCSVASSNALVDSSKSSIGASA